jgi:hypothetical protein
MKLAAYNRLSLTNCSFLYLQMHFDILWLTFILQFDVIFPRLPSSPTLLLRGAPLCGKLSQWLVIIRINSEVSHLASRAGDCWWSTRSRHAPRSDNARGMLAGCPYWLPAGTTLRSSGLRKRARPAQCSWAARAGPSAQSPPLSRRSPSLPINQSPDRSGKKKYTC